METKQTYQVWAGGYRESLQTIHNPDEVKYIVNDLISKYPDSTIMIAKEIHGVTHKDWQA